MSILEIILLGLVSLFYILFMWTMIYTYSVRKKMTSNWWWLWILFPIAPLAIIAEFVSIAQHTWRKDKLIKRTFNNKRKEE